MPSKRYKATNGVPIQVFDKSIRLGTHGPFIYTNRPYTQKEAEVLSSYLASWISDFEDHDIMEVIGGELGKLDKTKPGLMNEVELNSSYPDLTQKDMERVVDVTPDDKYHGLTRHELVDLAKSFTGKLDEVDGRYLGTDDYDKGEYQKAMLVCTVLQRAFTRGISIGKQIVISRLHKLLLEG